MRNINPLVGDTWFVSFITLDLYSQFFPERIWNWYIIDNNNDTSTTVIEDIAEVTKQSAIYNV